MDDQAGVGRTASTTNQVPWRREPAAIDDVELPASTMAELRMALGGGNGADLDVLTTHDPAIARAALLESLGTPRSLVYIAIPPDQPGGDAVAQALASVVDGWPTGLCARVLCTPGYTGRHDLDRIAAGRPAFEVRVTNPPLPAVSIVDLDLALVRKVLPDQRYTASIIRNRAAVETLHAMLIERWQGAVPSRVYSAIAELMRRRGPRTALTFLRQGLTDETAAAALGVSTRTYRRYVAEILAVLQVKSRFEAGVLANRLGLLALDDARQAGGRPGDAGRRIS